MSARTHTGLLGRVLAVAGAGAMMFAASVATAPTASADDMDRASAQTIAMVEAKPWPFYEHGQVDIDIRAAYRTLGQQGFDSGVETSEFTDELRDKVLEYQAANEQYLPVTGDLDEETWLLLREQTYADEYVPGDGSGNNRVDGVLSIQELLMWKHDADIANDGEYGPETFQAVCDAQEAYGLDVDGFVGRLTWRSLITDQDWDQGAARTLPQAQVSEQEPGGFVAGAEEAAAQYSCDDRSA
ncbi:peptidoglycan-binding domain-containing protein [Nocardiopsis xinjiangensis]|uniref:peptidoglycan-binding domain-containing protein n=1 Tax=Nocardiopsis xinjiangensis TaxID=124285 RepID=UPI000349EC6B|nr:peptidoglycan-binding domain-containing protein [Nocardiopsis xinjiangensis]